MNKGWIKLHRSVQDCWLWDDEKFDKAHAWIDLLLLANHSDKKIVADGKPIVITKGQLLTSKVKLSNRWHWNVKTVTRFLDILEKDNMLLQEKTHRWTTLTIVNYSAYQDSMDNSMDMSMDNSMDNYTDKSMDTNKNVKNDKNVKNERNIYSPVIKEVIEYLNQVSGKNYKTDTTKSVSCIKARINEGFTLDDFKKVIDIKCGQWMQNEKMKAYIRPETLFGNKFEGYLNEGGDDDRSGGTTNQIVTDEQIQAVLESGLLSFMQ